MYILGNTSALNSMLPRIKPIHTKITKIGPTSISPLPKLTNASMLVSDKTWPGVRKKSCLLGPLCTEGVPVTSPTLIPANIEIPHHTLLSSTNDTSTVQILKSPQKPCKISYQGSKLSFIPGNALASLLTT